MRKARRTYSQKIKIYKVKEKERDSRKHAILLDNALLENKLQFLNAL